MVISTATYRGYTSNSPLEVIKEYKRRFGIEPIVLVVRPEMILREEHSAVIRSRFGMSNGILASHLITRQEIEKHAQTLPSIPVLVENTVEQSLDGNTLVNHPHDAKIPKSRVGRPGQSGGPCPHCGNKITNFDSLGFWYGWQFGIVPPYWDALREYVFRRDNHTCQKCQQRLKPSLLRCHHVQAKEEGGTDSARNLTTLCAECHFDEHPIMPDEESNLCDLPIHVLGKMITDRK